jgi:TRAP-type mannitol/chloroaromatic compound transport system permease large subunit
VPVASSPTASAPGRWTGFRLVAKAAPQHGALTTILLFLPPALFLFTLFVALPVGGKVGIDFIWFGVLLGANMRELFMRPPLALPSSTCESHGWR